MHFKLCDYVDCGNNVFGIKNAKLNVFTDICKYNDHHILGVSNRSMYNKKKEILCHATCSLYALLVGWIGKTINTV